MGMWSIKCVICMFLMFKPVPSKPVDLFLIVPWTGVIMNSVLWQTVSPSQTHFHLLSFMCCCLFEVLEYTNSVV